MAAGDASHAMDLGQAMIAAGIGCKRGAPASDIEAAIRAQADGHGEGPVPVPDPELPPHLHGTGYLDPAAEA